MTKRSTDANANAPDITDAQPEAMPGVPAGVDADVTVRYKARVDKRDPAANSDELNQLALAANDNPPDPLSEFLETWANFVGYNCMALRLPDPSTRRMAGQMYNRPHFGQPEQLGAVTFDPNPINFISSLQIVNGNSGGCFQIWLMDHAGGRIQDAVLYSVAIADPPRQTQPQPGIALQPQYQQQAPAPKSDSERKLEEAKDRLFNTALDRALNPAAPVASNGNGLTPEDNAKLFLLGQTNFLDGIFGNMAELAKKAANVSDPATPSIKDRALDAAVQLVTTNPAIVDRLSGVVERVVARIFPDPRQDVPLAPQPQQQPWQPGPLGPSPITTPPAPLTNIADLPETPDADDDFEDEEIMDILDRLIVLFNSDATLSLDSPAIAELMRDYPLKAKMALRLIAAQPLDDLIEWIKDNGSELHASLLDSPVSGPFLRQRLAEFKQVCEVAQQQVKERQTQAAPAPATDTAPATETPGDKTQ